MGAEVRAWSMDKAGGQHHNEPGNQFTAHSHRTNTEPPPRGQCSNELASFCASTRKRCVCVAGSGGCAVGQCEQDDWMTGRAICSSKFDQHLGMDHLSSRPGLFRNPVWCNTVWLAFLVARSFLVRWIAVLLCHTYSARSGATPPFCVHLPRQLTTAALPCSHITGTVTLSCSLFGE